MLTFVDRSRTVQIPGKGTQPRTLSTLIRYPAQGPASAVDVPGAAAEKRGGPFPLIVFGHGFAQTPAPYARLLQDLARAGYVVAAPVFPLENANAPGGPNESDIVNQPADMSLVITGLLEESGVPASGLGGLIDPRRIAVAGHSDGGESALLAAYARGAADHRIRAAVILSGARLPDDQRFDFAPVTPPLLAVQGTGDTIHPARFTSAFFAVAPRPKYLLTLFGADHLGPYSDEEPQLDIVERVTLAFLNGYLNGDPAAQRQIQADGDVAGTSSVVASP